MNKTYLKKVLDKRIRHLDLGDQAKAELLIRFLDIFENGFKCAYCGKRMELEWGDTELAFSIDHVLAKVRGGTNSIGNLTFACHSCNSAKGDKDAGWFSVNVKRLKARKQKRELWKARKATKKDKETREAYVDIFQHLSVTKR